MKKILSIVLVMLMAVSAAACSSPAEGGGNLEGTTEEIMQQVFDAAKVDDDERTYILENLMTAEVNAENEEYYLGKTGYKYKEGFAAEPMVNAQAFSCVVLRAENEAEAKKLAEEVKKTVNPNKWICVGVDPSNVKTATKGDVMFLIMSDNAQAYIDAFNSL